MKDERIKILTFKDVRWMGNQEPSKNVEEMGMNTSIRAKNSKNK
jgi:hypothetical protein